MIMYNIRTILYNIVSIIHHTFMIISVSSVVNSRYFSNFHVDFNIVSSHDLGNGLGHVDTIFSCVDTLHVACQF